MKQQGMKEYIRKYGAQTLIGVFLISAGILFALCGEDVQIAVQDNLDLFQAQYRMLQNTGTFWTKGAAAPFLGGISRDVLPSQLQLPGVIYQLLPPLAAYFVLYFLKILIGTAGLYLLISSTLAGAFEAHGEGGKALAGWEKQIALLVSFAYGLICFFPAFGVCFAAIPLALWLFCRLYCTSETREILYCLAGLFLYPFLSYFSYHGLFILGYAALAWIVLAVRERKPLLRFLAGIAALSAGYVFFEYRLFSQMLLTDEATIRETMVMTSATIPQALHFMKEAFADGMMHAQGQQKYIVLPLCLVLFLLECVRSGDRDGQMCSADGNRTLRRIRGWIFCWILFNSAVYGLYYLEPVRSLIERLLPPFKGLQFNRTVFFNPFLWYYWFALALISFLRGRGEGGTGTGKDMAAGKYRAAAAVLAASGAAAVVLFSPVRYNDLYFTAYAKAYELLRGSRIDSLSYGEFYAEDLFAGIKADLDYREGNFLDFTPYAGAAGNDGDMREGAESLLEGTGADWVVAYGLHPAVLEYNGIATLDGYLGFYAQDYKEKFREVIAPALERRPETAAYYDDWGARCYLYSGTEDTVVQAVRRYPYAQRDDYAAYLDTEALSALGCRYVFSRIPFANADALGLRLRGRYEDAGTPYVICVYEVK